MRFRLGWALLLLTAVFSMHGLQCAAAEPSMTASVAAAGHAAAHLDEAGSAGPSIIRAAAAALSPSTAVMTAMDGTPAHGAADHDPAGHSSALHALMVCLAVLAGGVGVVLAALAVWLAQRRTRAVPAAVLRAIHRVADRVGALPAPPDLARLCVLRI